MNRAYSSSSSSILSGEAAPERFQSAFHLDSRALRRSSANRSARPSAVLSALPSTLSGALVLLALCRAVRLERSA